MFLLVQIACKTVGHVSRKIGGHKRTTAEAGIATTRVSLGVFLIFWELDWDYCILEIEDSR